MRGKTAVVVAVALILATGAFAGTAAKGKHKSSTFTTLYNFTDGSSDGGFPFGQPFVDKKGNLYGTAEGGGADGYGDVWELSSGGSISLLHSFDESDGAYPYVGLTQAGGNLYSTTYYGGSNSYGTLFELKSKSTFSTLYNFGASGDAEFIFSDVVLDPKGNMYGTSEEGGADGTGTIWEVTSGGTESVLYSFTDGSDGGYPFLSNLHRDAKGDLFGVSEDGGSSGCGTLFEYSAGRTFSVLHSFNCGSDGGYATGNVLEYKGSLYGAAQEYGANGYGTVWQYDISTATFSVLHSFDYTDGGFPLGGVACQNGKTSVCAGNLFGTTVEGGSGGYGTVFEISSDGTFTTLHNFSETDGAYPYSRPYITKRGQICTARPTTAVPAATERSTRSQA